MRANYWTTRRTNRRSLLGGAAAAGTGHLLVRRFGLRGSLVCRWKYSGFPIGAVLATASVLLEKYPILKAVRHTEKGGDFILISVSDTGPGISREHMEKIFDKYYRSPKTAGVKGTGLGLAIVREVADIHGGRVEADCNEGAGCTFKLFLPA